MINAYKWRIAAVKVAAALIVVASAVTAYFYFRPDPVRVAAWKKVTPHIRKTEAASKADAARSQAAVRDFFAQRRKGARAFAADALSFEGKVEYVKDSFEAGVHNKYLMERFERHVFRAEELNAVVESAVSGYVSRLQGHENELLVAIRADLADTDIAASTHLPGLQSEVAFRQQYEAMITQVTAVVAKDINVTIASAVGGEIASRIMAEIARSLAVRFGISGGILGSGVASGALTAGMSIVASFLADMAIDWVLKQFGYDPEAEVEAKVLAALDRLEHLILEGPSANEFTEDDRKFPDLFSPEYRPLYPERGMYYDISKEQSAALFNKFRAAQDKAEAARAVAKTPGCLGMRYQVENLHEVRARLREAALKKLILEGGAK